MVPFDFVYLIATLPFLFIFLILFFLRKDLRREMLVMGVLIGIGSVITAHYFWTIDWWQPATITGTRIGVEDFLLGFGSGGVMAVVYEVFFRKRLYRTRTDSHYPGAFSILLILAFLLSWLFWGVGLTSFWASTLAIVVATSLLIYFRRDLFFNGLLSGVLMLIISTLPYITVTLLSPEWINSTYQFKTLSGILIFTIPIEEFIFWFLAGFLFGPFYEYWQGKRLRNS